MLLFERLKGKIRTDSDASSKPSKITSNFRSVQVIPASDGCCQLVKDIAKQRFLSDDAPLLPLSGCDSLQCRCTYEHFKDRRQESRRISDLGYDIAGQFHEDNKRGENTGRRNTDNG